MLTMLQTLSNMVWPPVSPCSGDPVAQAGALSPADWAKVDFLEPPWCAACGVPFPYPAGDGAVCGACAARPPVCSAVRSALVYAEHSRPMILSFKHGGRTDALPAFGRWMARTGGDAVRGTDALIPVPLHPSRLRKRRFNQSLLLARAVSRAAGGVPVDAHLLARARRTPSQGGQGTKARKRNVAGAFAVRQAARGRVKGGVFTLIDDVHTTGATLDACARALLRAGAADVRALTLARVVKPVDPLK